MPWIEVIMDSLQPEHVLHVVDPRRLADDPLRGAQGTAGEDRPVRGLVGQLKTLAEAGIKGFEEAGSDLWFGIMAPAGTPKAVVAKLNQALISGLRSPDMRERIRAQSLDLWTSTPEEFGSFIRMETDKYARLIKDANIKVNP